MRVYTWRQQQRHEARTWMDRRTTEALAETEAQVTSQLKLGLGRLEGPLEKAFEDWVAAEGFHQAEDGVSGHVLKELDPGLFESRAAKAEAMGMNLPHDLTLDCRYQFGTKGITAGFTGQHHQLNRAHGQPTSRWDRLRGF